MREEGLHGVQACTSGAHNEKERTTFNTAREPTLSPKIYLALTKHSLYRSCARINELVRTT